MSNTVPEGWEEFCLKDLSDVITKGTTPTTGGSGYVQSGIKYFRVENISRSGFIEEKDLKFISQETHDSLKRSQLKVGDLLVSIAGAIGRSAIVGKNNVPANTNQAVGIVRLRHNEVITPFVRYSIESPMVARQLNDAQAGNAQINLNLEQLGSLRFYRPPLPEQKKIAAILSSVDDVIEKTRAQIDKLKDLKAGMMQELLTKGIGHTEFKDSPVGRIPVGWNCALLEEVATIQTGIAKNSNSKGDMISVPYLRVANVQDGYLDLTEIKYIKIDKGRLSRFSLQPDDVLVNEGGDFDKIGRGAIWKGLISPCVHQNHVFVVRTMKDQLLPEFFNYLSGSQYGKNYYLGCAKQTTNLASLNSSQLKMFPVLLPSIDEQECICKNLGAIDQTQRLFEEKLAGKINIKKALMQDLLTGNVRVNVDTRELANA